MKVLVAEDDPLYSRVLQTTLAEWGYEVYLVSNGVEAWAALQADGAPKLAILDWMLPGMNGNEICREIRKRSDAAYIYLLLLTAKNQRDDIVSGLQAGADDYLTKPFDPHELRARLSTGRRILGLQDQLIAAREALRDQATHDSLTGIWNRSAILEMLERELNRGHREQRPVGVLLADLDHFKRINDTHGHQAGDAVLKEITRRLTAAMRPYDRIGRYGGEEFLIVLPGCDEGNAVRFAERLRERVAEQPAHFHEVLIPVTMSFGLAVGSAAERAGSHTLLQAADFALYRAKEAGRNRVATGVAADAASWSITHRMPHLDAAAILHSA